MSTSVMYTYEYVKKYIIDNHKLMNNNVIKNHKCI